MVHPLKREAVVVPLELADEHTLLAQSYAGFLVGHPYRGVQLRREVIVDLKKKWMEPRVVADGCEFCVRLNDKEAIRRVDGFQFQLDIETTRNKYAYLGQWYEDNKDRLPDTVSAGEGAVGIRWAILQRTSWKNLRMFVVENQDVSRERHEDGWKLRPLPFCDLPLRLKRKLCIEWNHLYLRWMKENDIQYDFELKEFYRMVDADAPPPATVPTSFAGNPSFITHYG